MSLPLQQDTDISAPQSDKKVAVMQPYFLPYIGYWQMMAAVDEFVVYDDVQFTRGWINRNRMLWNDGVDIFTLPLRKGSSRARINERYLTDSWEDARTDLLNKFEHAYSKAPNYASVRRLLENMFKAEQTNLADFLYGSLEQVRAFLGIETVLTRSSQVPRLQDLRGADRILALAKARNATVYINAPGGRDLYDKKDFRTEGIELKFLQPDEIVYSQFGDHFEPWLSILDVMMFNDPVEIRDMLTRYRLE